MLLRVEATSVGDGDGDMSKGPHLPNGGLLLLESVDILGNEIKLDGRGGLLSGRDHDGRDDSRRDGEVTPASLDVSPEGERVGGPVEVVDQLLLDVIDINTVDAAGKLHAIHGDDLLLEISGQATSKLDVGNGAAELRRGQGVPSEKHESLDCGDAAEDAGGDATVHDSARVGSDSTVLGGLQRTLAKLGSGVLEQSMSTSVGSLASNGEVGISEHDGQEDLIVSTIAELAKEESLGDEEGKGVGGVPDINQLSLLPLAILSHWVCGRNNIVKHVLGLVGVKAGEEEASALIFQVSAAQRAKLGSGETNKVV
jgi:hypothetical protein